MLLLCIPKIIRVKTSRSVLSVVIEATQANITDNTHMQLNAVTHTHTHTEHER